MSYSYSGMRGGLSLGADRMSNNVRRELQLPDSCRYVCLSTCEAHIQDGKNTLVRKLSIMSVAPVLARTKSRRARYGVTFKESR